MLNRRSFIKAVGIAVATPAALLKAGQPALTHPVDILEDICSDSEFDIDPNEFEDLRQWCDERPIYCCWNFKSIECGHKGQEAYCFKGFTDCKNKERFGGLPTIIEYKKENI
jgi:hypothetical protein